MVHSTKDSPGLGSGRDGAAKDAMPPQVQWVVKVSKHCNLRCRYCYEYTSLGDRARMSVPQLRAMFTHIAETYSGAGREMAFVWHGGEPLLIEPAFYQEVFGVQKEILDATGIAFSNAVQTNLTFLSDAIVELLKKSFSSVGVSLDLFGDQRVGPNGTAMEDRVVSNMQRLREAGIQPGCITVLSRATMNHVREIYRFYEEIGVAFRLLPIYRTSFPGQQDAHALTPAEICAAFIEATDLWFASESEIQVRPIQDYVINAVRHLHSDVIAQQMYEPGEAEAVFIVDTDGQLYSNGDAYDLRLAHGNVFEQGFATMRVSEGYRRSVENSSDRIAKTCKSCQFHGACSGFFMGQATPEQRIQEKGRLICSVARPVQEYVLKRLREPALLETLMTRRVLTMANPVPAAVEM